MTVRAEVRVDDPARGIHTDDFSNDGRNNHGIGSRTAVAAVASARAGLRAIAFGSGTSSPMT